MRRLTVVLLAVGGVVVLSLALSGAFRGGAPPSSPEPAILVALDAGHGGVDPGAVAGEVLEKDITAQIAERLARRLRDVSRVEILLTRIEDETIANRDRIARAEDAGAALYLSIHANASNQTAAHGIEVWVDKTRALDDPSFDLADALLHALVENTDGRDRGIRSGELYIRHAKMPAASVEIGFLSNPAERAQLLDPNYQERVTQGLFEGLSTYLGLPLEAQPEELP